MEFIPDDLETQIQVPWLDEAKTDDGWRGHTTDKSIEQLRAEISAEIGRMGGTVTKFLRGEFKIDDQIRPGAVIEYSIVGPDGQGFQGRIDVAGLPFKEPYEGRKHHSSYQKTWNNRRDQSLKMALFNVRRGLESGRILQDLSPGYAALVPWLLSEKGQTFGQLWREGLGTAALPAPDEDGDIVDVPFREVEE